MSAFAWLCLGLAVFGTGYQLFGLLAVELAVQLTSQQGSALSHILAAVFFAASMLFVWRSFYGMRIQSSGRH